MDEVGIVASQFESLAENSLPGLRSALGEDSFASEEAAGRALSLEDAVALGEPA